jgi:hypothetical protein
MNSNFTVQIKVDESSRKLLEKYKVARGVLPVWFIVFLYLKDKLLIRFGL